MVRNMEEVTVTTREGGAWRHAKAGAMGACTRGTLTRRTMNTMTTALVWNVEEVTVTTREGGRGGMRRRGSWERAQVGP